MHKTADDSYLVNFHTLAAQTLRKRFELAHTSTHQDIKSLRHANYKIAKLTKERAL